MICGLWNLENGTIYRPVTSEMFYVPQRPYLTIGKLRDQIIYPNTIEQMKLKSINDLDLMEILDIVNLRQVVLREGGLFAFKVKFSLFLST